MDRRNSGYFTYSRMSVYFLWYRVSIWRSIGSSRKSYHISFRDVASTPILAQKPIMAQYDNNHILWNINLSGQAIQRIYAAKDARTLKRSFQIMVFMPIVTTFFLVMVGIGWFKQVSGT